MQFFNKLNEFKSDVFTTPKAKEYIDIASGFHSVIFCLTFSVSVCTSSKRASDFE
ncbi:hypothetical protein hp908_0485 [Helicobacter pylori 908]|nr:hypothetical protein hp908_0485 [Helicobacter pylori 908]